MKPNDFPMHIKNIVSSDGGDDMNIEIAWTNPSPSSDFEKQTIAFEKDYKFFILEFYGNNEDNFIFVKILVPSNKKISLDGESRSINTVAPITTTLHKYLRLLEVTTNSIAFEDGQIFSFGSNPEVVFDSAHNACVQYRIWGVC